MINAGALHLSAGALAWAQAADAATRSRSATWHGATTSSTRPRACGLRQRRGRGDGWRNGKRGIRRGRARPETPERPRPKPRVTQRESVREPLRQPFSPVRLEPATEQVRDVYRQPLHEATYEPPRELRPEPVPQRRSASL